MRDRVLLTDGEHLPDDVVDRMTDVHFLSVYCWSYFEVGDTGRYNLGLRFANHDDECLVEGYYFTSLEAAEREVNQLNQEEGISAELISWIIQSQDWVRHPAVDVPSFWGSALS